jgi:hypothetical protein
VKAASFARDPVGQQENCNRTYYKELLIAGVAWYSSGMALAPDYVAFQKGDRKRVYG